MHSLKIRESEGGVDSFSVKGKEAKPHSELSKLDQAKTIGKACVLSDGFPGMSLCSDVLLKDEQLFIPFAKRCGDAPLPLKKVVTGAKLS